MVEPIEVTFRAIISLQNIMKLYQLVQKLLVGHTDSMVIS
jgi:hypothetical protein